MRDSFADIVPHLISDIEIVKTCDMGIVCIQKTLGYRIMLNSNTYSLICLIDGKKTIGQLTKDFNSRNCQMISVRTVFDLLNGTLKKTGIIKMGDDCNVNCSEPSYLRLRIDLIGNRQSSFISKYLKHLFGEKIFWPSFVIQSLVVYVLFVLYSQEIYIQLESVDIIDAIIVFLLMGGALIAHEFGHVSACDRYGAHYGNIGFGFYLFTPVMYADVSDIWRLPRNQRLIVNMAGIYMGNCMAIIAFVIYYYTDNLIFLYAFSLQCIEGICNLNPLLKYDGYWMLSDLLMLPNMSRMAYEKVKTFSFCSLRTYKTKDWLLIIYGIISQFFIFLFLFTVLFLNPDSVLYFPKEFMMYMYDVICGIHKFGFLELAEFLPYILFYWLIFKMCKRCVVKLDFFKFVRSKSDTDGCQNEN